MTATPAPKVALLYSGDGVRHADPAASRFAAKFEALAAAGVNADAAGASWPHHQKKAKFPIASCWCFWRTDSFRMSQKRLLAHALRLPP
ncbi:hypothetical protein PEC18_36890 [Paucibacter sp. O1-1]|nr:hypothetical protein [Paucibacter sp. O1-1]MDA3831231.1 hypothetical protein [Paucibacter sp. O1-1]